MPRTGIDRARSRSVPLATAGRAKRSPAVVLFIESGLRKRESGKVYAIFPFMAHMETGEINSLEHFREVLSDDEFARAVRPVNPAFLSAPVRETFERTGRAKLGRNDACPCGSGKKF